MLLLTAVFLLTMVVVAVALTIAMVLSLPPDEGAPAPRGLVRPPDDPFVRVWRRVTVCAREGHTWRIAFPMGRRSRQCMHCAAVAEPLVVESYRARV